MKTNQLKLMKRHRRLYRLMGFMWALLGGLLLVVFVAQVLDPSATIIVNGVPTTAVGPKVSAALFAATFFVAGLSFLFVPARFLDRLFIWRQSLWSSLAF